MRLDPYAHAPRLPEDDPLDLGALVGGAPVELELGPGRGGFILERVESDPGARIVGLEIRRKWATIVDARLSKRGYGARARVFAADAREVLPRVRSTSVAAVYAHFPDPWWKKRHQKRLLIGPELLRDIVRVLVPAGELFIQTDVEERAQRYAAAIDAVPELEPWSGSAFVAESPYQAKSPRERRALADGLPIHRLRYRRRT